MGIGDASVTTPYSSVNNLIQDEPLWVPPLDLERIASYAKYEEIYWNSPNAFKLPEQDPTQEPIYIPNARVVVDSTSHFWLKGLKIEAKNEGPLKVELKKFMERELFLPKFHTAKHSGVNRGDFILHLTADPNKPEGTRVSVNSVDPGSYFPEFDDDDLNRVKSVSLVEQIIDHDDPSKTTIRRLVYSYDGKGENRRVVSEEALYKPEDWWRPDRAVKLKTLLVKKVLPAEITHIPVYHFRNRDWQGRPFGTSELAGLERMQRAIDSGSFDEEAALALEGLGVYATDAGRPVDDQGNIEDWVVFPGKVIEVPNGTFFRRVEGLKSVTPMQDHLKYLIEQMYEASATFRPGVLDAQVAISGIALAIKFLPTAAKLEQRDELGLGQLRQFWFDWRKWTTAYESVNIMQGDEEDLIITIGEKLPVDKADQLNVLNNLIDRSTVTKQWYREEVGKLYGLTFPADMDVQVGKEQADELEAKLKATTAEFAAQNSNSNNLNGNQSNNKLKPNESKGTEASSSGKPPPR